MGHLEGKGERERKRELGRLDVFVGDVVWSWLETPEMKTSSGGILELRYV